ncbi:MAG: hypothetical protein KJ630_01950 [Proteobacteria bacterium]|nr:hypothetical protein [Pseudomonadota bacterium]
MIEKQDASVSHHQTEGRVIINFGKRIEAASQHTKAPRNCGGCGKNIANEESLCRKCEGQLQKGHLAWTDDRKREG